MSHHERWYRPIHLLPVLLFLTGCALSHDAPELVLPPAADSPAKCREWCETVATTCVQRCEGQECGGKCATQRADCLGRC